MTGDLFYFNLFSGIKNGPKKKERCIVLQFKITLKQHFNCLQFMILKILIQFRVFICLFSSFISFDISRLFFLFVNWRTCCEKKTLMSKSPYGAFPLSSRTRPSRCKSFLVHRSIDFSMHQINS